MSIPAFKNAILRMIMKTLMPALVAMAVLAGIAAPASAAARNSGRSADPYYAAQPSYRPREQQVCEREAFEADPSGQYAGYPCWARKAFAPRR
jgi:hypothetical protein